MTYLGQRNLTKKLVFASINQRFDECLQQRCRPETVKIITLKISNARFAICMKKHSDGTMTQLLKTTTSWDGKPIVYPKGDPEVTMLKVEFAPGAETGWHLHPVPSFGYVLQGTLEVTLKDGRVKRLEAGQPLPEVFDTLHNGRNVGADTVKLIVFYAGAVGVPITVKEDQAKK